MRSALSALLAGLLALTAIAAVAPGDVTAELSPPEGQTAVTFGDRLLFGGEVPVGSDPTATLEVLDVDDAVLGTYDVSDDLEVDAGAVAGSIGVQCFYVPQCTDAPDDDARQAAIDAVGGFRLHLAVEDVSDTSDAVDLDDEPPLIDSYALTSPTTVLVRFTEDVTDPDGDAASDWMVDDVRQVISVQGQGDSRVLTLLTPYEDGATPAVFYLPTASVDPDTLPNRPYQDGAGNDLDAEGRSALAADAIPPPVPSIDSIQGTDVTYDGDDQAVAVRGGDASPQVMIGNVPDGAIAQLWLDDGDGTFEPADDDALVGEASGDGSGSVTITAAMLPADGTYRYYARSRDDASCDPNDPDAGTCPNASGRSEEARYDLDTVAPTPVGDAVGRSSTIAVLFTEPVVGSDDAGQWTVANPGGGAVTVDEVSGSGENRTLRVTGGPLVSGATLDWTPSGDDPYRDEHGNLLTGFPVEVAAAPLPVLTVESTDATEGNPAGLVPGPAPTLDFTLRLSDDLPAGEDVEVAYRTTAGTATPDEDYASDSGTATITGVEGPEEAVVSIAVTRDELDEFDEDVLLEVSNVDDGAPQFTLPGGAAALVTGATITDDDAPVAASITPATADVGEDASSTLTVQLGAASGKPVTINWATAVAADPGADEAGPSDVPAQSGTVTIPAGQLRAPFEVAVADDALDEPDEAFGVDLEAPDGANATLADPKSATLTIIDDDVRIPDLTVEPGTVAEDDAALPLLTDAQLPFTLRLSAPAEQAFEVSWTTDDTGAAEEDVDFAGASGFVRFEAGETEQQVLVDVIDDGLDEGDEQVALVVADPAAAVLEGSEAGGSTTFLGTITDDDPLPVIAFADDAAEVTVGEGQATTLTVALDGPSGRDLQFAWTTSYSSDLGATDADAPQQSQTVTIPAGATSAEISVTTSPDEQTEPDEAFEVELSAVEHVELADDRPVVSRVTIIDDDTVLPTLTVDGGTVDEGATGAFGPFTPALITSMAGPTSFGAAAAPLEEALTFTVTLSETAEHDVLVDYTTLGTGSATAGSDYTAAAGTLTVPAGATSATTSVDVLDDRLDEFDELVVVRFSNVRGATLPDGADAVEVSGRVTDDDPLVTVALGEDAEVAEGEPATFEVALSAASGKDIQLRYRSADGSAVAGEDYRAIDDTLTIPAGDTAATFTVPTLDDTASESTEDLEVSLSLVDADTAELGRSGATLDIIDDDLATVPGDTVVSLTGAATDEGDPTTPLPATTDGESLVFEVRLSEPADGAVAIDYETRAGTATADDDFVPVSSRVTIPGGEDAATVTVDIVADLTDEFDEDLELVLTAVDGDAVLPSDELARTGRIIDDDAQAQLRVTDATVLEGEVAELDVTLDDASGKDVTVAWALADGTATAGEDYTADSGTLAFPAGTTSQTVSVVTLDDASAGELIEQFALVLSGATNAGIDDARGTGSIVDVDSQGAPTTTAVFLEDITTQEADGDRTALVPVRLSAARNQDTTVTWSSQQLSATDGEDYRADGDQVVIPAGVTSAQIPVTILADDAEELDEDFLVVLTEADGASITGPTGRVTIQDDDTPDDDPGDDTPDDDPGDDTPADDPDDDTPDDDPGNETPGDAPNGGGDTDDGTPDEETPDEGTPDEGTPDEGTPDDGHAPGGGADVDGAPDGVVGQVRADGEQAGELAATGGGAGFAVFGLALLAARRRRREDD